MTRPLNHPPSVRDPVAAVADPEIDAGSYEGRLPSEELEAFIVTGHDPAWPAFLTRSRA